MMQVEIDVSEELDVRKAIVNVNAVVSLQYSDESIVDGAMMMKLKKEREGEEVKEMMKLDDFVVMSGDDDVFVMMMLLKDLNNVYASQKVEKDDWNDEWNFRRNVLVLDPDVNSRDVETIFVPDGSYHDLRYRLYSHPNREYQHAMPSAKIVDASLQGF